ncbi:MAG TPA: family 1 glycosylhydrolase, partial [Acidimicrobiia bacterium]
MTIDFPHGFLWGTATAAHQTEGGNWNNDWWEFEHRAGSGCTDVSGDAVDHFWRYPDDIRLLRDLGFGAYRFSLEWSRIEPEPGEFSTAALDHYRRVIAACRDRDL